MSGAALAVMRLLSMPCLMYLDLYVVTETKRTWCNWVSSVGGLDSPIGTGEELSHMGGAQSGAVTHSERSWWSGPVAPRRWETRQLWANQEAVLARRWRTRQRRNKKENVPTAKTLTSVTFWLSSKWKSENKAESFYRSCCFRQTYRCWQLELLLWPHSCFLLVLRGDRQTVFR